IAIIDKEIPPRVRRRGPLLAVDRGLVGNTSACAEKSGNRWSNVSAPGKYLRVCGEEPFGRNPSTFRLEIPPRVRRRAIITGDPEAEWGNTSACAEKRSVQSQEHPPKWKYLRVCGEESASGSPVMIGMEIPPRVRRRAHRADERRAGKECRAA